MTTHSSIPTLEIPWPEKPEGWQPWHHKWLTYDWTVEHASIKWLKTAKFSVLQFYRSPTPVSLSQNQGQRSAFLLKTMKESASVSFPSLRLFAFLDSDIFLHLQRQKHHACLQYGKVFRFRIYLNILCNSRMVAAQCSPLFMLVLNINHICKVPLHIRECTQCSRIKIWPALRLLDCLLQYDSALLVWIYSHLP